MLFNHQCGKLLQFEIFMSQFLNKCCDLIDLPKFQPSSPSFPDPSTQALLTESNKPCSLACKTT